MPDKCVSHSYTARRGAFSQAIEACEELIRDYEKHRDHDGTVTGPDFNAMEIEAVKAAIVRIQCIETRELPPYGPCVPVEPTEDQLWTMVRVYHGWPTDTAMMDDCGYSLELYVEKMRQAIRAISSTPATDGST